MFKYHIVASALLGAILASIIYYGSDVKNYNIDQMADRIILSKEMDQLRSDLNRLQEELIIVNAMNDELTERLNNLEHQSQPCQKKK